MEIEIRGTEELGRAAREFLEAIGERRHIAFHGGMGAGKTTFISALCKELGMEEEATSPTFSIVNEYGRSEGTEVPSPCGTAQGNKFPSSCRTARVFHFDFYRIETPEETMDLGLDDYFDSGDLCLMEWPENVEAFLPEDTLDVSIRVEEDGTRVITIPEK